MPLTSRLFLKLSLAYFVLATSAGALSAAEVGGLWAGLFATWLHVFVVGWVTQMIMGVALWFFPKASREHPRGHEWLSWTALLALNLGLLLRIVAEPGQLGRPGAVWNGLLIASALLQWLGGMAFVVNIWPRLQPKGRRDKKKKGR